jgi:hypothetical protein
VCHRDGWVTSRHEAEPADLAVDRTAWESRGPESGSRCEWRSGADPPRSGSSGKKAGNAELRDEVAFSQASPRRTISTNTLRMM